MLRASAPLFPPGAVPLIGEVMLQRPEDKRAEAAALRVRSVKSIAAQDPGEKGVGEFPGLILSAALAAEKPEHRMIVGFAEVAERRSRGVGAAAAGGDDHGPSGIGEAHESGEKDDAAEEEHPAGDGPGAPQRMPSAEVTANERRELQQQE